MHVEQPLVCAVRQQGPRSLKRRGNAHQFALCGANLITRFDSLDLEVIRHEHLDRVTGQAEWFENPICFAAKGAVVQFLQPLPATAAIPVCLVRTACPPQGIDAQVGCMRDESAVFQS